MSISCLSWRSGMVWLVLLSSSQLAHCSTVADAPVAPIQAIGPIDYGEPRLLYTDLTSAPSGAFVTVWGQNIPDDAVLLCGDEPCDIVSFGDDPYHPAFATLPQRQKIVVRFHAGSEIKLDGYNALPVQSTKKKIWEATPEQDIGRILDKMKSGDVLYLREGIYSKPDPRSYGAIIWVDRQRSDLSVIGYPGEKAILDLGDGRIKGFDTVDHIENWTLANLECRGTGLIETQGANGQCVRASRKGSRDGLRVVGMYNTGTGVNGSSSFGEFSNTTNLSILGNFSENTGTKSHRTHVIYHGGRGRNENVNIDFNRVGRHYGRRGIQVYGHTPGESMSNLNIRYNHVLDQGADGILISHSDSNNRVPPSDPRRNWIQDATIQGNTIQGSGGPGLTLKAAVADVIVSENAIFNNRYSIFVDFVGSARIDRNCLDKAPEGHLDGDIWMSENLISQSMPATCSEDQPKN